MCKCIVLDMYIVNASVEPCKVVSVHPKHKCQTHKKRCIHLHDFAHDIKSYKTMKLK